MLPDFSRQAGHAVFPQCPRRPFQRPVKPHKFGVHGAEHGLKLRFRERDLPSEPPGCFFDIPGGLGVVQLIFDPIIAPRRFFGIQSTEALPEVRYPTEE